MIKNIAKGYKKLLSSALKILLLVAVSALLGFLLVYPLWKWASSSPATYSRVCLCILIVLFVFFVIRSFLRTGPKIFLARFLKVLTAAAGLSFIVFNVVHGNRIAAFTAIPLVFILYGLLAIGFKEK